MNIEKVTYKLVKDAIEHGVISPFIMKMMISYLTDEQKGAVIDEIINERKYILFKEKDDVWFDPKDNKYDLKDLFEEDKMRDSKLMDEHGFIKGTIIDDNNYQDGVSPYATEYKINAWIGYKDDGYPKFKEIRVKRSNILAEWTGLE